MSPNTSNSTDTLLTTNWSITDNKGVIFQAQYVRADNMCSHKQTNKIVWVEIKSLIETSYGCRRILNSNITVMFGIQSKTK